jgi:hypothetical protein
LRLVDRAGQVPVQVVVRPILGRLHCRASSS